MSCSFINCRSYYVIGVQHEKIEQIYQPYRLLDTRLTLHCAEKLAEGKKTFYENFMQSCNLRDLESSDVKGNIVCQHFDNLNSGFFSFVE